MTHRIALTAGEPAGIGPELLVRVAQRAWPFRAIAIADRRCLHGAAARLGLPLTLVEDEPGNRQPLAAGQLALLPSPLANAAIPGRLDPANAAATLAMLRSAAEGAANGRFDAVVTAPVQKSALDTPDAPFSGHTEYFQALAATEHVVMMLVAPGDNIRPPPCPPRSGHRQLEIKKPDHAWHGRVSKFPGWQEGVALIAMSRWMRL